MFDKVVVGHVGPEDHDISVTAIAFTLQPSVTDEAAAAMFVDIAELVDEKYPGIEIVTHGRFAVIAYQASLELLTEFEHERARHQAGTS